MKRFVIFAIYLFCFGMYPFGTTSAWAQEGEDVVELEPTVIQSEQPEDQLLEDLLILEEIMAEDFEVWNPLDAVDLVEYLPGVGLEKPQSGSDETTIAVRDQNTASTGRLLVLVDDLPINNFINRGPGGAPRLNLLQPQNIESVELLYGPFSAEYSGYASNGVLHYRLREPEERSVRFGASYVWEDFSLYNTEENYAGYRSNMIYQDRFDDLSLSVFASRRDQEVHPSNFVNSTQLSTGPTMGPPPRAVTGAFLDEDSRGRDRVVYGSEGPQSVEQNTLGVKADYQLSDQLSLRLFSTYSERVSTRDSAENYLVDGMGNPVWRRMVIFEGQRFSVSPGRFGNRILEQEEFLIGAGLNGALLNDWNYDWTVSTLQTLKRTDRTSDENPADPSFDASGEVSETPDTYWVHSKLKFDTESLFGRDDLSLLFGYEFLTTHFRDEEFDSTDWIVGDRDQFSSIEGGQTFFYSGFAQAGWQMTEAWKASTGLRYESWQAEDGFAEIPGDQATFPDRDASEFSPKFSLQYQPAKNTAITFNYAKAYRFPLAVELFQQTIDDNGDLIQSNPNLEPEDTTILELSFERKIAKGKARLTFFRNEIENSIVTLTSDPPAPPAMPPPGGGPGGGPPPGGGMPPPPGRSIVNLDEVISHGVEFSISQRDLFLPGLSGSLNISYIDSTIERYAADPTVEGNTAPRVPEWRASGNLRYRINKKWEVAYGGRYQSHSFERLENDDTIGTLGSVSQSLVFDLSARYRHSRQLSFNMRISNLFDDEYFVVRPQGQRTFSLGVNWSL